jgi:hypothetical protein
MIRRKAVLIMRIVCLLLLAVIACEPRVEPATPPTDAAFAPLPDARQFCDGRVYGAQQEHIIWNAYSSREPRETVVKRYLASLGRAGYEHEGDCDLWRQDRAGAQWVLTVCGTSADGAWKSQCALPAGAKSMIEISTMMQ